MRKMKYDNWQPTCIYREFHKLCSGTNQIMICIMVSELDTKAQLLPSPKFNLSDPPVSSHRIGSVQSQLTLHIGKGKVATTALLESCAKNEINEDRSHLHLDFVAGTQIKFFSCFSFSRKSIIFNIFILFFFYRYQYCWI